MSCHIISYQIILCCIVLLYCIYFLLASFARSARQIMDQVFPFLLWPKRKVRWPCKHGRKRRGSIICRTDRANEANKMFIIWFCWLFRFWKGDRAGGPYGYLRTWNWPITAREISQPYIYILLDDWPANMAGYIYESAVFWWAFNNRSHRG